MLYRLRRTLIVVRITTVKEFEVASHLHAVSSHDGLLDTIHGTICRFERDKMFRRIRPLMLSEEIQFENAASVEVHTNLGPG